MGFYVLYKLENSQNIFYCYFCFSPLTTYIDRKSDTGKHSLLLSFQVAFKYQFPYIMEECHSGLK